MFTQGRNFGTYKIPLLLIFFFSICLFLIFFLYLRFSRPYYLFGIKTPFIFQDTTFQIFPGQYKIYKEDLEKNSPQEVLFYGVIRNKPRKDSLGKYVLPVRLPVSRFGNISIDLVLGKSEEKLLTLIATNGVIGPKQEWKSKKVSELLVSFIKDKPLVFKIYFVSPKNMEILLKGNCSELCKSVLPNLGQFYENNERLLTEFISKRLGGKALNVGGISSLVIFEDQPMVK